ncbi:probable acyl transferase-like protein [Melanopsichium pennsylvanicum]|uniref:Acyl transferase-like protein n=2 Tax=Melanopsichium pennsylvanicum TaxID=63383 RepID=A0A077R8T9_9BASI|nr:acyl transferase-like protein [Melanopsichium pennsylvanicum 4]SNX86936.1 probable acyl transferase-like protein [Melanopsichium pennsylvanicum]
MAGSSSLLRSARSSDEEARRPNLSSPPSYRSSSETSPVLESKGISETSTMLPLPSGLPDSTSQGGFKMLGKVGFVPGWEGLRGLAVALVMVSHVLERKEMLGTLGVEVFFVLSGFLITGVLVSQIEKQERTQQDAAPIAPRKFSFKRFSFLPRFYMDRFVRLTPALALMVGIVARIGLRLGVPREMLKADALSAFFYTHNMYPLQKDEPRLMYPGLYLNTWSLAVEEQFYIFWSLLIPFVVPMSLRRRSLVLGFLIFAGFYIRHFSGWNFLGDKMYNIDYRYAYSANAWKMFIGCSARLLPIPDVATRKWVGTTSTLGFFFLAYMWGYGLTNFDFRTTGVWLELLTAIVVLLIVLGSINGNPILESKLFRFPGRISYSWYLWQFPLQALHGWPIANWGPTGLAFMIATFTTFMIEEPIRNKYHAWKNQKAVTQSEEEKHHARRED